MSQRADDILLIFGSMGNELVVALQAEVKLGAILTSARAERFGG